MTQNRAMAETPGSSHSSGRPPVSLWASDHQDQPFFRVCQGFLAGFGPCLCLQAYQVALWRMLGAGAAGRRRLPSSATVAFFCCLLPPNPGPSEAGQVRCATGILFGFGSRTMQKGVRKDRGGSGWRVWSLITPGMYSMSETLAKVTHSVPSSKCRL